MGTLSRYPIKEADEELQLTWVGVPQVIDLDLEGKPVKLVNFHSYPYAFRTREIYLYYQEQRQRLEPRGQRYLGYCPGNADW